MATKVLHVASCDKFIPPFVEFVKENLTFTGDDSPMSNLLLSIMGAFAEFERKLIKERLFQVNQK